MKNILFLLSFAFVVGANAQTAVNLERAISAVNVHRFVDENLNVPIVAGPSGSVSEGGKIILDYDRTQFFGEAGIIEFLISSNEMANSKQQLVITATLDEQSRVAEISYPGKTYEINYKDGELGWIKSGKYNSTGGFIFTGDRVTRLEGRWSSSRNVYNKLVTDLSYTESGQIIKAVVTREHGKGKDLSSIKLGKPQLSLTNTVTFDPSNKSVTWEKVEMEFNKKTVKRTSTNRIMIDGRTRTFMDERGDNLVKTTEIDYDENWRLSEQRGYANGKMASVTINEYDEQDRIVEKTRKVLREGKLYYSIVSEYGQVTKNDQTLWGEAITRKYNAAGEIESESKEGKMRIKNADGSWGQWKWKTS